MGRSSGNDWLGEEHLARFVSELVDEVLDLEPFFAVFTEARGFPPYDPRLLDAARHLAG